MFYQSTPQLLQSKIRFINCTISGNIKGPNANTDSRSIQEMANVEFLNTIAFGEEADRIAPHNLGVIIRNCLGNSGSGYGSTNIEGDPLFMDLPNLDVRLQAGSPAINAGNDDHLPEHITTDINNMPRRNGVVDIGAVEN